MDKTEKASMKGQLEPAPDDGSDPAFKMSFNLGKDLKFYSITLHRVRCHGWYQDSMTIPEAELDAAIEALKEARSALSSLQRGTGRGAIKTG